MGHWNAIGSLLVVVAGALPGVSPPADHQGAKPLVSFDSNIEAVSVWAARLELRYPLEYTGVEFGQQVSLYVGPDASDAWLRARVEEVLHPDDSNVRDEFGNEIPNPIVTPVHVNVYRGKYSFAQLDDARRDLRNDLGASWSGDSIVGERLRVLTQKGLTPDEGHRAEASLVRHQMSQSQVEFEPGHTRIRPASRTNDLAKHYAGAALVNGSAHCSSGFAMQAGATRWMLTAGHCARNTASSSWYSGPTDASHWIGDLLEHRDCNLCDDVGWLWNGSYAGRMYTGGPFTSTWAPVKGYTQATVGSTLYASGGQSGDKGPGTVASINDFNLCLPNQFGFTVCHLTRITSPNILFQVGDSGGPIYTVDGAGNRYAAGMIDAAGSGKDYYYIPISLIIAADSVAVSTTY